MKMLIMLLVTTALSVSFCSFAASPEKDTFILASKLSWSPEEAPRINVKIPEKSSTPGGPPAVFESGKWKYTFQVPSRHHASGILEYDGLPVKPDKTGQTIESPFGALRFYSLNEKRHLAGWMQVAGQEPKEKTEQSPAGDSKTRADGTASGTPEE
jgi:hypothetical protein